MSKNDEKIITLTVEEAQQAQGAILFAIENAIYDTDENPLLELALKLYRRIEQTENKNADN